MAASVLVLLLYPNRTQSLAQLTVIPLSVTEGLLGTEGWGPGGQPGSPKKESSEVMNVNLLLSNGHQPYVLHLPHSSLPFHGPPGAQ